MLEESTIQRKEEIGQRVGDDENIELDNYHDKDDNATDSESESDNEETLSVTNNSKSMKQFISTEIHP